MPSNAATVAATATKKPGFAFALMLEPAIVSPLAACPSAYRVRWARRWQRYGAQLPTPDLHLALWCLLPFRNGLQGRYVLHTLGGDVPEPEKVRCPRIPDFILVMIR